MKLRRALMDINRTVFLLGKTPPTKVQSVAPNISNQPRSLPKHMTKSRRKPPSTHALALGRDAENQDEQLLESPWLITSCKTQFSTRFPCVFTCRPRVFTGFHRFFPCFLYQNCHWRKAAELLPSSSSSSSWARQCGAGAYGKPWKFTVGLVGKPSAGGEKLFGCFFYILLLVGG